jgi:hypothetical protein
MLDHIAAGDGGDETQIVGAGQRVGGRGPAFRPMGAEVELLAAEFQRRADCCGHIPPAPCQNPLIPGRRDLQVTDGDDDVVQPIDGKAHGTGSL